MWGTAAIGGVAAGLTVVLFMPSSQQAAVYQPAERPALARAIDRSLAPIVASSGLDGPTLPTRYAEPSASVILAAAMPDQVVAAINDPVSSGVSEPDAAIDADQAVATPVATARVRSAVNVRSGPSTANGKLFVLQGGEEVQVTDSTGGWMHVVTASGDSGWVYGKYLASEGSEPEAERHVTEVAVATEDPAPRREASAGGLTDKALRVSRRTTLFSGPSRSAQRLARLDAGERVTVARFDGDWARITTESGVSGWIALAN